MNWDVIKRCQSDTHIKYGFDVVAFFFACFTIYIEIRDELVISDDGERALNKT